MITVQEAETLIFNNTVALPAQPVSLKNAYGMILREDISADRDSPPFDRVTMDGIAVCYGAWKNGTKTFKTEGIQKAGSPQLKLHEPDGCLEVMTGAVLPEGTDCVIRVEDITFEDGKALLNEGVELNFMQNVHTRASDHLQGTKLINNGIKLLSTHIGVAASEGRHSLMVASPPAVAVIATGDELREVEAENLEPYQIRMSNSYALYAALKRKGIERADIFHLKDDTEELYTSLKKILETYDILILSGGVSMGKFDYLPEVLAMLGVKKVFHKISQRPGKPFWFGKKEVERSSPVERSGPVERSSPFPTMVFALPGNPVSTLVCFHRYVVPALEKEMGLKPEKKFAVLAEDFSFSKPLTYFLPVKIDYSDGVIRAYPVKNNGSGDYASLTGSDGFIELAKENDFFAKGYIAPFYKWE